MYYSWREAVGQLISPIDGSVLYTVPLRNISIKEAPVTASRKYSRSAAMEAPLIRDHASVSFEKTVQSLDLIALIKTWRKGVRFFPFLVDLRGTRYRHPHLKLLLTNSNGTIETHTAYDCSLTDRGFGISVGKLASDTITLDAMGGLDNPSADHGSPCQPFRLTRTASASYISTSGAYTLAGDSVPRITSNGLLLEGATTNIFPSNVATGTDTLGNTTGFQTSGDPQLLAGAIISSDLSIAIVGSRSLKVISLAGTAATGCGTSPINALANTTYTLSTLVKGTAGTALEAIARDLTNGISAPTVSITLTGGVDVISSTLTTGATAVTDLRLSVRNPSTTSATWNMDCLQCEPLPFRTSWVDGTRNADVCAVVMPCNELVQSHDLTSPLWANSAGLTHSLSGGLNTLTLAATSDYIQQAFNPTPQQATIASTARTIAIKLRLGTLSGSVRLRLLDQSGTQIATTTINSSSLDASLGRTFWVTGTPGSAVTGVIAQIIGNSGTGTVIVEHVRMLPGSYPGVEVRTGDTPILRPANDVVDPAWAQNGFVEFDCVPPPLSTGKDYAWFGSSEGNQGHVGYFATLCFWRFTNDTGDGMNYDRKHNGTMPRGYLGLLCPFMNGAKHRIRLEWSNYILNGTRYMIQRLYIDNMITPVMSQDVSSLYGATAWIAPKRLILSDGNTYATLGNILFGTPSLPAGAIPALS